MEQISVQTSRRTELLDITGRVSEVVSRSGVENAICTVFVPHTTAAVTINENADPDVPYDILKVVDSLIPFEAGYSHSEGNSAAHIKSSLVGASIQVVVEGGRMRLGTWQGIYFAEFDGPRNRKAWVAFSQLV
ncbi:secondary thiamine-phosphate synthase enzyme YjbQ [Gemmatimonadota bacterium]